LSIRDVRGEDAAICALGIVASIAVALPWLAHPHLSAGGAVGFFVAVMVLSRMPAELPSRHGPLEISFTPAALLYLALRTSAGLACALWLVMTLGICFTQRGKPLTDRFFNVGCLSVSGVAACLIVGLHGSGVVDARAAIAVGAASAVYFLMDIWLTTASMAHREHATRWALMPLSMMALPLACFIGINSLGYLAAIIDVKAPRWTLALLIPPLITVFAATRSQKRAGESERRTAAVYTIARATTSIDDPTDMTALLLTELVQLLPGRDVQVLDRPPNSSEIGASLGSVQGQENWVIIAAGNGYGFSDEDRQGLETLTSVSREMLERRRLVDELARMSKVDALTGLANRSAIVGRLELVAAALPTDSDVVAAVLYCDVDGFKGINDRLGHAVGDSAIIATAGRLESSLRTGDVAARLSGDEFAILLERVDRAAAIQLAERVVASFESPLLVEGSPLRVGVSVGIAMVAAGDTADAVLQDADTAMYCAKAAGKGRAMVFDPESRRGVERGLILEGSLRTAVADGSLWLAWQPVIDLSSGELDGFEVLIRWTHPELGAIPPDVMLPIASRIGLMPALGRWILVQAMEQGLRLSEAAGKPLAIAVNVAPEQLDDEVFISLAAGYAADRRLRLVLELTEHTLIDGDRANPVLDRLHACGAAISLDDFGAGYSSIDYLHRFRSIDAIKIDRSFVAGLGKDVRTRALIGSITAMGHAFDALVVAEGIEDWTSAMAVFELGCQLGQGYLFGRPAAVETAMTIAECGRVEGPWPWVRESDIPPTPVEPRHRDEELQPMVPGTWSDLDQPPYLSAFG
jgi:diguanylate cyclase (GGDEF)-like protein